ncbi:hypothetical protein EFV37_28060 [Mesorhizobium loti]|uniref:Uncharacterized protein n=1 Tax=Mesorhizobium jarvisii TaxID=1777867 RepID=A0A6M7TKZ6_9HYPH|nr:MULTISPECIES: hypothetical protein [Mesorhizobium]OBQ68716.1 hypothetical protein A9K72_10915 [Mesorhizobium loti]QKC65684.1 hypothetical protein EB229_28050 [Mesorhizobium jarvisii]QKD11597.1 hypothetical protein EFV37_28060 [Mesorhizobium loti]RJT37704.1 hypothetical protein D3242_00105 [Mesorhizobium jarvisii]BCH03192.1 hypothetical protein MesoLj131b_51910 [Mesorhizobium sp. 131-2-5]
MSSSDFRQIAIRTESGKAERLFRAAVSAFCSLTRPSRREIGQLEDLTLPLFDDVSVESRRYVAAALSECEYAPAALVRRLCEEPVDIAAPLLIRSRAVSDIDLIALIGRHGLPHARAIARRKDLNPTIADLIRALERPTLVRVREPDVQAPAAPTVAAVNAEAAEDSASSQQSPGIAAENARRRLRSMMRTGDEASTAKVDAFPASDTYVKLRETALTGNAAFFQTALADALDIDFSTARSLTASQNYASLLAALRSLDFSEDRAFLITVAIYPSLFPHPQAIRTYLDRYRLLHRDVALDRVRGWKAEALSRMVRDASPANSDSRKASDCDEASAPALKASSRK